MAITRGTRFKQLLATACSKQETTIKDDIFGREFIVTYDNPDNYKFCVARVPKVGVCYGYHNTLGFTLLTPSAKQAYRDTSRIKFIAGVLQIRDLIKGNVWDTDFRPLD